MKREASKHYYLAMHINREMKYLWSLIWCGKELGWRGVEETYRGMFKDVPMFTNGEAIELREKMNSAGFFYPPVFDRKAIEIAIEDYWWRPIFILCEWDMKPIGAVRANDWQEVNDYFQEHWKEEFKVKGRKVVHISNYENLDIKEVKELDLKADLIAQGLFAKEEEEEL